VSMLPGRLFCGPFHPAASMYLAHHTLLPYANSLPPDTNPNPTTPPPHPPDSAPFLWTPCFSHTHTLPRNWSCTLYTHPACPPLSTLLSNTPLPLPPPQQVVLYPILNLARHTQDLHWYLRGLEEVIIRALAATSGLQGQRLQGLTGVWVEGHKLAAIGVRARKWVTYHGLALNVSTGGVVRVLTHVVCVESHCVRVIVLRVGSGSGKGHARQAHTCC
jgi:hypothetical protein